MWPVPMRNIINTMATKRLNVKNFYQRVNSNDCGPTCVQMCLHYFGIEKTARELSARLTYNEFGTFVFDNGMLCLNENLKVSLITANPLLFEREVWNKLKSKEALLQHLTKFKRKYPKKITAVSLFIKYTKEGGNTTIAVPDFSHIKKAIDSNELVLAAIYGRALGLKDGEYHFVIVSGYRDGEVYVNNPLPGSKSGWFKTKDFLFALHASTCFDIDNGALLIIGK